MDRDETNQRHGNCQTESSCLEIESSPWFWHPSDSGPVVAHPEFLSAARELGPIGSLSSIRGVSYPRGTLTTWPPLRDSPVLPTRLPG